MFIGSSSGRRSGRSAVEPLLCAVPGLLRAGLGAALLCSLWWTSSTIAAPERRRWAGHQVVVGEREVPFMGKLKTRTDTFVLAEVKEEDGALEIIERPCQVSIAEVAGVEVRISEVGVARLPPVRVRYAAHKAGELAAGPWRSGWSEADTDQDGNPGITMEVDAPLCGGRLFVSSQAESIARARRTPQGLAGQLKVRLSQRILGADGACLSALASDTEERLRGTFRYTEVPEGTSCAALLKEGWPVSAEAP